MMYTRLPLEFSNLTAATGCKLKSIFKKTILFSLPRKLLLELNHIIETGYVLFSSSIHLLFPLFIPNLLNIFLIYTPKLSLSLL